MKKSFILLLLASFIAFANNDKNPDSRLVIGRIVSLGAIDANFQFVGKPSLWGEHTPIEKRPIREGDRIFTVAGQHLTLKMEDGTELHLGPSTQLVFTNWFGRDDDHRLVRSVELTYGILWAKVKKIYSQEEPFLVENKNAVVGVRGTEFVVESVEGGHLYAVRKQHKDEVAKERSEVEVHTLEGEVRFARTRVDLWSARKSVSVTAGYVSTIQEKMKKPQSSIAYNLQEFKTYFTKAVPGSNLIVRRDTTNEQRAVLAANLSPKAAQPPIPGEEQSRSIASVSQSNDSDADNGTQKKSNLLNRRKKWLPPHLEEERF